MSTPVLSANLTKTLTSATEVGTPTEVETILGRFPESRRAEVAKTVAGIAFRAGRWDNLAYLADFLHDTASPRASVDGGDDSDLDAPAESTDIFEHVLQGGCSRSRIDGENTATVAPAVATAPLTTNIFEHVLRGGEDDTAAAATIDAADTAAFGQSNAAVANITDSIIAEPPAVTFRIIDEKAKPGEYRSSTSPCEHVSIIEPDDDINYMMEADANVIDKAKIRVLYNYPFGTTGPTDQERELGGWIIEERATNGSFFTRAGLAKIIADRYKEIYEEEAKSSEIAPGYVPGMIYRATTSGKYHIWGHMLSDLDLHAVVYDQKNDVYVLGIDA